MPKPQRQCEMVSVECTGRDAEVRLAGAWAVNNANPSSRDVLATLGREVDHLRVTCENLTSWDSTLVIVVHALLDHAAKIGATVDLSALPTSLDKLLAMAHDDVEFDIEPKANLFTRVGDVSINTFEFCRSAIEFVGELNLSFGKLLRGKVRFRWCDLFEFIQDCGVGALGIVTLLSILLGMILAYVGVMLFADYGTEILVADVVAITMMREMGAIIVGIIMAGHTGAAFAAQLGSMEVNEEIDALRTFGFSPMDFLVLPRVLATVLMLPLLVIYADLMGIVGGGIIGLTITDISFTQYYQETRAIFNLNNFYLGIFKGGLFGLIVAIAGCRAGMRCKRNSAAVGHATTTAVVTAIIWIIIADAIMAVLCNAMNI